MKTQKKFNKLYRYSVNGIFSLLLLFALNTYSSAQSVNYTYDNNGNRTSSNLNIMLHSALHRKNDSTTNDSNKTLPVVKVFPNPTSNQFTVSISNFQSCEFATLYLSDATGNLLSTQKTSTTLYPMSLANYGQSTFYLKVVMCEEEYSYKIIKVSPGNSKAPPPTIIK